MSESVVLLGPVALVGLFGPRVMKPRPERIRSRPPLLGRGVAVLAICLSFVSHGGGSLLTGVMCWGDRGRDNYPSRVWDWSDPQFLEGPDLLLREGQSGAMNPDCPRY